MVRRLLASLSIIALLAIVLVQPVTGYSQTTGYCSAPAAGYYKVCLAEDSGGGGDKLVAVGTQPGWAPSDTFPNLINTAHTLAGYCNATLKVGDNWNDCISSVTFYGPAGAKVCLYNGTAYSNLMASISSNGTWNLSPNDAVTSVRFLVNGNC